MKYTSPTIAAPYQQEALRRIVERPTDPSSQDVFMLLMEMGCGKTKVVLDEFQERAGAEDLDNLFVVAPAGSYRNWFEDKGVDEPSELRRHLDPALRGALSVAAWVPGRAAERRREEVLALPRPRALFMNVEALSTGTRAIDYAKRFIATGRTMMVVDESTVIRAARAARTKRVHQLGRGCPARRIMTGLITPKSPLDLYEQIRFLDWRILGFDSFVAFRARYAELEKVSYLPRPVIEERMRSRFRAGVVPADVLRRAGMTEAQGDAPVSSLDRAQLIDVCEAAKIWIEATVKVKSFKNLPELQQKIAPYSYRVLKADVLDLPPKLYGKSGSREPVRVELTSEQERHYAELKKHATSELAGGSYVTVQSRVQLMLKLQQIACGHVTDEEGAVRDVSSNRIDALCEVLDDHDRKAVIWVPYLREVDKIVARLREDYGGNAIAVFSGENAGTRRDDEARFSTDDRCRFMVATDAGVRGNNWQCADLVVYFANWWDLEKRAQSEDRTHRRGQTASVTYLDLVAPGTIDEKIIWALRRKIDLATAVAGDRWREWLV